MFNQIHSFKYSYCLFFDLSKADTLVTLLFYIIYELKLGSRYSTDSISKASSLNPWYRYGFSS